MSRAETYKEWAYRSVTPVLVLVIGYLLNDKLATIDNRLSALEGLNDKVVTNTTTIGFLQKQEDETKDKLNAHLSAVLPEEIKVKKDRNF